jgi:hypothetical protein
MAREIPAPGRRERHNRWVISRRNLLRLLSSTMPTWKPEAGTVSWLGEKSLFENRHHFKESSCRQTWVRLRI